MTLASLIAELQALADATPDGGASITEERYMNGEPQIVILACK